MEKSKIIKIAVGSGNPVKLNSVYDAFNRFYENIEVEGIPVESGVPDQPVDFDTFDGAKNRVESMIKNVAGFDYYVGIEGGLFQYYKKWFAKGISCVGTAIGNLSFGESPAFEIPGEIIKHIKMGKELGDVIDELTGDQDTKRKGGAIGYLTDGRMTRKDLYVPGIVTALVPHLNEKLYFRK